MAAVTRKAVESPCPSGPDRVEAAFPSPQGSLTLQTCCGPLPCGGRLGPTRPGGLGVTGRVGSLCLVPAPLPAGALGAPPLSDPV